MPLRALRPLLPDHRVGVIDIGSNSIRLVVFERMARAPVQIFNEKVLCALGGTVETTGRLSPEGVALALANLARFKRLAEGMGVVELAVVATAAVRDAEDGSDFVARVARTCGLDVRVLSGEDEARLSALGVVCGTPGADGAMGDLGGGSLELVGLDRGEIGPYATMPLGPLRLMACDPAKARALVTRHIGGLDWLKEHRGRTFYPVGGSWRALAKLHMEQSGYPLHVIHQYAVDGQEMRDLAHLIAHQSRSSLDRMVDLSRRRTESLPCAALVLEHVLDALRPRRVVFSAFGLREGYVFSLLDSQRQAIDPLLDACAAFAHRIDRFGHAEVLAEWTAPLFADMPAHLNRLRQAACLLSDICWAEHPDYRAPHAFLRVLRLPFPAIDHAERAFLALTVFARYTGEIADPVTEEARPLLDPDQERACLVLGRALRLAHTLTGGAMELLRRTSLAREGDRLVLRLPEDEEMLMGDVVSRRLSALGKSLELTPDVQVTRAVTTGPTLTRRTGR